MNPLEFSPELYEKNLEKFQEFYPLAALQVEYVLGLSDIRVTYTEKGEYNLCRTKYGITQYYHDPKGAAEEAKKQVENEDFNLIQVLYVYGLGLGYLYDHLTEWLRKSPSHQVVFLEDDLEVFYYFLHTKRASVMLNDPQVTLFSFQDYFAQREVFINLEVGFKDLLIRMIALPFYDYIKHQRAITLCGQILHDSKIMPRIVNEHLQGEEGYLRSFFVNAFRLPTSYISHDLFGAFKNIPAIICGAGPSLQKNIHVLKELGDKALIFAGGSSLNIVSHFGIIPHFGMGIDPNPEQYHRILTNDAFCLPYFFRSRVHPAAFDTIQGPKIFVPGSPNKIGNWFEGRIGLPNEFIDEGNNVIHMLCEIASRMGCNPIIFVGMDLAFTNVKTYSQGVLQNPLWITSKPYENTEKEVALRKDIYGQPIQTKWEWISESQWLQRFILKHPQIKFINATEGGLGFGALNLPLEQLAKQILTYSYDLEGFVHSAIQATPNHVPIVSIVSTLTKLKTELTYCANILREVILAKLPLLNAPDLFAVDFYDSITMLKEAELESSELASVLLNTVASGHRYVIRCIEYSHPQQAKSKIERHHAPFAYHFNRYQFLLKIVENAIELLTRGFQNHFLNPPSTFQKAGPGQKASNPTEQPSAVEKAQLPNPNELVMDEMWQKEGKLHGVSRFLSKDGRLLSEVNYVEGKKEGISTFYFLSGGVARVCHYKAGVLHGRQEYYYASGVLNVALDYVDGKLEGTVSIFAPNGSLFREMQYKQGRRHGREQMWKDKRLLMECFFEAGKPCGTAHLWDMNGKLRAETVCYDYPQDFDHTSWDEKGHKTLSYKHGLEDYTLMYHETEELIKSYEMKIQGLLNAVDPLLKGQLDTIKETNPQLLNEFALIHDIMQNMAEQKESLLTTMEVNREHFTKQLQNQLEKINEGRPPPVGE